jgi:DNA-binding CsgD family transcriptional regulator
LEDLKAILSGEADAAGATMRRALGLIRNVGDVTGIALAVEGLTAISAAKREHERAAWLVGFADALWDAIPASPPRPVLALRETVLPGVRKALGERRFAATVAAGRSLDPAEGVAQALEEPRPRQRQDAARGANLSPREQEVAALVAQGLSNRQVADRLVLSPRTIESHVERIMNRLGVNSRAQIAAWVAKSRDSTETQTIP